MYNRFLVGPKLREIREMQGLTIAEVAEKADMSDGMIAKLEQGNRNMSIQTIFTLMNVFGVDANTLLGVSGNKGTIDETLTILPKDQREYFEKSFRFMLSNLDSVMIGGTA